MKFGYCFIKLLLSFFLVFFFSGLSLSQDGGYIYQSQNATGSFQDSINYETTSSTEILSSADNVSRYADLTPNLDGAKKTFSQDDVDFNPVAANVLEQAQAAILAVSRASWQRWYDLGALFSGDGKPDSSNSTKSEATDPKEGANSSHADHNVESSPIFVNNTLENSTGAFNSSFLILPSTTSYFPEMSEINPISTASAGVTADEAKIPETAKEDPEQYKYSSMNLDPNEVDNTENSMIERDSNNPVENDNTDNSIEACQETSAIADTSKDPSLWIDKTSDKSIYDVEENVTYTISFGNKGRDTTRTNRSLSQILFQT